MHYSLLASVSFIRLEAWLSEVVFSFALPLLVSLILNRYTWAWLILTVVSSVGVLV